MGLAICIKEYQNEDDFDDYENGKIDFENIRIYRIGDESDVNPEYYDNKYWKLK